MASRLCQVSNWEQRAKEAGFNVSLLAIRCGVSRRQLLNFIKQSFGVTTHQWMLQLRMENAGALLRQGFFVKEASHQLGFKQVGHFSREFKRYYGVPPGHFPLSNAPPAEVSDAMNYATDSQRKQIIERARPVPAA